MQNLGSAKRRTENFFFLILLILLKRELEFGISKWMKFTPKVNK